MTEKLSRASIGAALAISMALATGTNATAEDDDAARALALVGATVHPVATPAIPGATVIIEDGTITQVGRGLPIPTGATTVQLGGKHVYPGLINASTLLGLYEISAARATRDHAELGDWHPHVRVEVALNPASEQLPVARAAGILAYLAYPTSGRVSGTAALAYTAGWTAAQMLVKAPVGMVVRWPDMRVDPQSAEYQKKAEARVRAVEALSEFVTNARAYARATPSKPSAPGADPKWEAMQPVVGGELPLLIRAGDLAAITAALEWAGAQGFDVILIAQRDAGLAAPLLAELQVPVILSYNHMLLPRRAEPYDAVATAAAELHAAGVRFALGTGMTPYGTYNARQLPQIAGMATGAGLPADAALRALTLDAATILGVGDRLGSIEPGKEATLIAADGDILDIRTRVSHAWIRGEEVNLDNKQLRLYERHKDRR